VLRNLKATTDLFVNYGIRDRLINSDVTE